ncbi:MAG: dihydrofolate reductase family protein [Streptosporangiaceae bacterium]|nr:dihydrofolate reductase family protein [Streptosporangiaceae bacterium]
MRKIVAGLFISLDGVIEDPNEWTGPWFNPEIGQAVGAMIAEQDAMLLGRVTYADFAAYWPRQTGGMADTMNGTTKYVVSGTLESADWQNTTLIPAANAAAEIAALKRQPGKNIGMTGSATLASWLLREGLLDELHLLVFPVVLGSGKRLFAESSGSPEPAMPAEPAASRDELSLKLINSAAFETGVVELTYAKA